MNDKFGSTVEAINADRAAIYAPPRIDFGRAARLKAVVAECPDPLARHVLEMILVKVARLIQTPTHEDSWLDIAGYANCGLEVTRPEETTR